MTLSDLFPPGTLLFPRGAAESLRWVFSESYRVEPPTGVYLGVMGDMPLVCHRNTATPLILDFFQQSGVQPAPNLFTYETEEEAIKIASLHVGNRGLLAYLYPPPPALCTGTNLIMPLSLYHWLNDKINITRLVPERYLLGSVQIAADSPEAILDCMPGQPVFIKICRQAVSGGGNDVYYCQDSDDRMAALEWLKSRGTQLSGFRVERAADIRTCWCVNLAVGDTGVRYLGAASQLFSAPAKQCGSRIDPADTPPREVIDIAVNVATRGQALGFRGICGFDIGVTFDEQPFVFDLNFRFAGCTTQILMQQAISECADRMISQSFNVQVNGELAQALERLETFVRRGEFAPIRLYEGVQGNGEKSHITGMIMAHSIEEIAAIEAEMDAALEPLLVKPSAIRQAKLSFSLFNTSDDVNNRTTAAI